MVVFAAPYRPPAPPGSPWRGVKHTLTGWDGSVWEISNPDSGVVLMGDAGVEGLGMPEVKNYTHDSATVHGVEWDGFVVTGRKVFLPIGVFSDSSDEWRALDAAFWRIFRPGKTVLWTVEVGSQARTLRLRYSGGGTEAWDFDPVRRGWNIYGVGLFPEQPFWEAAPIIRAYEPGVPVDFYGPDGFAPDFHVSASNQLATATINNPGDEETFVKWTLIGPLDAGTTVGVGGITTEVPFPIAAGERLVLNSDPRDLTAELNGVDVMEQFTEFDYTPVPAGEAVPLSLSVNGSGSGWIEAAIVPLYYRGV